MKLTTHITVLIINSCGDNNSKTASTQNTFFFLQHSAVVFESHLGDVQLLGSSMGS